MRVSSISLQLTNSDCRAGVDTHRINNYWPFLSAASLSIALRESHKVKADASGSYFRLADDPETTIACDGRLPELYAHLQPY